MKELALHILDIAENGVAARARNISICIEEDTDLDRLRIKIQDDGKGMDLATAASVIDPFVTSRTTRKVGLGIPLLKAAAEACNGGLHIESQVGKGTLVAVDFQRSHIDRMPLGDLVNTFLNLEVGYPEIHWTFDICHNDDHFQFDDCPLKQQLPDIPLSDPLVINYVRETLANGFAHCQVV